MMKFIDGPAAGQTLAIRRAPILLRVVRENGKSAMKARRLCNRLARMADALIGGN